jgi:hypothetical protein
MQAGNDRFEVVVNDGPYECGTMYLVDYGVFQLTIKGGTGNDELAGGLGVDTIFGDDTSDIGTCEAATGGGGDVLLPRLSADTAYGCGGADRILNDYSPGAGSQLFGNDGFACIETATGVHVYCTDDFNNIDGEQDMFDSGGASWFCSTTADHDILVTGLVCH